MVKSPFRSVFMNDAFNNAVRCYRERTSTLFTPDRKPSHGNSWATQFWRGYEGKGKGTWDRRSKQSSGYAWWRAGEAIARKEKEEKA